MKHGRRLALGMVFALAGAITMACQNGTTGPSLTATVLDLTLTPTLTVPAGENLCCCHIVGNVKNTSSISTHIGLEFIAKNDAGEIVGAASTLVQNVSAGATRPFVAVGLYYACARLNKAQIVADQKVHVSGLWEPGQ